MPKDLPHLPSQTISRDGLPDSSRCDYPQAGARYLSGLVLPDKDLKQKNAAIDAASLLTNRLKIATPPQMLVRTETPICPCGGHERNQTTVRRLRPFLRRLAMTWRPPRVDIRARNPIFRARFLL